MEEYPDEHTRLLSASLHSVLDLNEDAKHGADKEKEMGFIESLQMYPKAVFFSFGLSLAIIMEGYDTALLASLWAQPAFARKYGDLFIKDGVKTYIVSAFWQQAFAVGGGVFSMIGLVFNGWVSDKIGYRLTMMWTLVAMTLFIFVMFFAANMEVLFIGYCLCALPWGIFQTITTTYAAEVTPVSLRPYLTTYVNLCWVVGQLLSAGILKILLNMEGQWAYRIPFGLQWIWPVPVFIICFFAPESPWWLVRKNKIEEARVTLLRLTSTKHTAFNVDDTLAMMIHTNELEKHQSTGTSYSDCFKGVDLRRTEVTTMTWMVQQTSGSAMIGWGTYFMMQVGLSESDAYSLGVAQYGMAFVGTLASWFLLPHFGRRTLYLWGQSIMFVGLLAIGLMGIPKLSTSTGWAIGALMLVETFVYDITVGPVCYSLVAEIPSTRLRIKTVVIARTIYNFVGVLIGLLQPRFMNPTSWNWGAKTSLVWAGLNLVGLVWTYFRLPEPKGLTYADMDVLFEHKISARKFSIVSVDPYTSDTNSVIVVKSYQSSIKDGSD